MGSRNLKFKFQEGTGAISMNFFESQPYVQARSKAEAEVTSVKPKILIRLNVYEVGKDEAIRDHVIDISSHRNREWVTKLILWAAQNKKSIEIINIKDDK
jgi:hypothetical protein